jgi:hypothetical protein
MSERHDCGHVCCHERHYPHHDHFLPEDLCTGCQTVREAQQNVQTELADTRAQIEAEVQRADVEVDSDPGDLAWEVATLVAVQATQIEALIMLVRAYERFVEGFTRSDSNVSRARERCIELEIAL